MYRRFIPAAMTALLLLQATPVAAVVESNPPTVGPITPTSAYKNISVTYQSDVSDDTGVAGCNMFVDGANQGAMTLTVLTGTSRRAAKAYAYTGTSSTISVAVACTDTADTPNTATTTQAVTMLTDSTTPVVTGVGPASATVNVATNVSATVSDNVGVTSCDLYVNGVLAGAMSISGSVASRSHTFTTTGSASLEVRCRDAGSNTGSGSGTVTVSAAPPDTTGPSVGAILPSSTTVNVATMLSSSVSDNVGVTSCDLYVNGALIGAMTISSGTASRSHTFSSSGTFSAYARCSDAAGNVTSGSTTSIVVSAAVGTSDPDADVDDLADADEPVWGTAVLDADSDNDGFSDGTEVRNGFNPNGSGPMIRPTGTPVPGRLLKLPCPLGALASDPCKAVYYYGRDGKRHAFPSEKIYKTWFNHFLHVQVVDAAFMGSLAVGENVLMRPGVRMVKFNTVNTVYAVARGGELRAIANETVAAGLYGSDWAMKVQDVDDILFGNFTFGANINSTADYSPSAATAATTAIDGSF